MHQLAGFRIKNVKRFPESRPPDPRGGRKTPPASTPVRPPDADAPALLLGWLYGPDGIYVNPRLMSVYR